MKQAHLVVNITAIFYQIPYMTKTKQPLNEKIKKAAHLLHPFNICKLLNRL